MDRRKSSAVLVFVLAPLVAATSPAAADEAYICDAGRIVYVKPGQLEDLKHTDACIAGYYGLTVEAPVSGNGKSKASVKAPAGQPVPPGGAAKGLQLEREARAADSQALLQPQKANFVVKSVAAASKPAPVAAPNTDFRNVVILNAAPGTERIFRHER